LSYYKGQYLWFKQGHWEILPKPFIRKVVPYSTASGTETVTYYLVNVLSIDIAKNRTIMDIVKSLEGIDSSILNWMNDNYELITE
jgi:hypothetical protein